MKIRKRLIYSAYLLLTFIVILEILLRLFDPFGFRQKGNNVILPRNRKMVFNNDKIPVLQRRTVHTKNSLGFRGPEKPEHFADRTSIIAVGGSATECFYLDDKTCWT